MFAIRPRVEQLECIGQLLDAGTPSSSRLALILADNFAEIIMQARVQYELAQDHMFRSIRPPRWSPRKRHQVMNDFGEMVNFLVSDVGVIDADTAAFLKFCHLVRNAAYHADEYHSDVIGPVARVHYGTICRMYPDLRRPAVMSCGSDAERSFCAKYGVLGATELLDGGLHRICDTLASSRTATLQQLAEAFSKNLVRRIDEILGTDDETGLLDALRDSGTATDSEKNDLLTGVQFADSYEGETESVVTNEQFGDALARREAALAAFRPSVTVATLRQWRATARNLASETAVGRAAQRFGSIEERFAPVEELVHQAVREFEDWVESQVHG